MISKLKYISIVIFVIFNLSSCSSNDCCDDLEAFPLIFEVVDEKGNTLIVEDTGDVNYNIPAEENENNPSIKAIFLKTSGSMEGQYFRVYKDENGRPTVVVENDLIFPSTNTFIVSYYELSSDTIVWEVGTVDKVLQVTNVSVNSLQVTAGRSFTIVK